MKLPAFLTACLMMASVLQSVAQTDPHFTQNYTYPMYVNPAMTGGSDGEYRISSIYRSQWGGIDKPYRTTGLSFDTRTNKNIALGVNLMNQSAGDGGFVRGLARHALVGHVGTVDAVEIVAEEAFKAGRSLAASTFSSTARESSTASSSS